jgi:hypothetical protein
MQKIKSNITKSEFYILHEKYVNELASRNLLPLCIGAFGGVKYHIHDKIYFLPNIEHEYFDKTNEHHIIKRKEFEDEVFEIISDEQFKIYNRNIKLNSI